MTHHSSLSPSKRHRWAVCPGSVQLEAQFPEERSSAVAIDGTHSHTLLEKCLNLDRDPGSFVGEELTDHDGSFVVDSDRVNRVKVAVDYIRNKTIDLRLRHPDCVVSTFTELRVDPFPLTGRKDLSGTIDVLIKVADQHGVKLVEIIDYKDGVVEVDIEQNPQLEQYAYGYLASVSNGILITTTIIQPKLAMFGKNPIKSFEQTSTNLLSKISTLINQANATDDPQAALVPGENQCKYCRAKGSCSALAKSVMSEVEVLFHPVNTESVQDIAQQLASKDADTLNNDQLRQFLEAAPVMRLFLDGVEEEVLRRIEAGQDVPGFKLVYGRGTRTWNLPEDKMAEKLIKMGIPKSAVYESKFVSVAKAEKLSWEKRDGTRMSLSKAQIERMNNEYVTSLAGKPMVVPDSDSRPAVVTNAAPLFSAVEAAPAATIVAEFPAWLICRNL